MQVPEEKASANSVPAAAVIRRGRALFGLSGLKGQEGGVVIHESKVGAQLK